MIVWLTLRPVKMQLVPSGMMMRILIRAPFRLTAITLPVSLAW